MSVFGNWVAVIIYAAFFISLALGLISVSGRWKRYRNIYVTWIVAFYVEMFGFSFTLYALASPFGFDFLSLSDPRPFSMLIGSQTVQTISQSLVIIGVTMVAAGWATVYFSRGTITANGIYGWFRHPQYLGLMLIATGLLANFPTLITVVMYPVLAFSYVRLSRQEGKELRLDPAYANVGRRRERPTKTGAALIISYAVFAVSVYVQGPQVLGVSLYQMLSLGAVGVLASLI